MTVNNYFKERLAGIAIAKEVLDEGVNQILYRFIGTVDGHNHVVDTMWGCEDSPFGWCAYHRFDDPAHDSCIFCGDPQERK